MFSMKGDQDHPVFEIFEQVIRVKGLGVIGDGVVGSVQFPPLEDIFRSIAVAVMKVGVSGGGSLPGKASEHRMDWLFPAQIPGITEQKIVSAVKGRIVIERLNELVKNSRPQRSPPEKGGGGIFA